MLSRNLNLLYKSSIMDGFVLIPNAILQDKNLSHTEMILYGYILNLSQKEWYCFASNPTLWEYITRDRFTVSKMISKLETLGLIKIENDWKRKIYPMSKMTYPMSKMTKGYVKNDNHNNITYKDLSKDKSSIGDRCSILELVEAYKADKILPQMLKDVSLVQEWVEYKQAKKDRAYKKVSWFLQQMKVCINLVRFNSPRGDTELRFRFAMNQAMEHEWKSMVWNENKEAEYQAWKKLYLLEQKQNE